MNDGCSRYRPFNYLILSAYPASPLWITAGVLAWTAFLAGIAIVLSKRFDREVARIRSETDPADLV